MNTDLAAVKPGT